MGEDIARLLDSASNQKARVELEMTNLRIAARRHDWNDVEIARERILDATAQFVDDFAAAHRRVELEAQEHG